MKKTKQIVIFGLLAVLFISACTAEKRVYRKGYHVTWLKSKGEAKPVEVAARPSRQPASVTPPDAVVSTDASALSTPGLYSEVPSASLIQQNILSATLKTGAQTSFTKQNNEQEFRQTVQPIKKKTIKQMQDEGKSQLVALLLCIFVGVLGIHRFYLGYTTLGVLMLVTLGGCGIWALIDLIRIITGDLKPMNGEYTETL